MGAGTWPAPVARLTRAASLRSAQPRRHAELLLAVRRAAAAARRRARTPARGRAEHLQRCEKGVELVQRVGPTLERVDVELERDVPMAIGDLERHPRLEVLRAAAAAVVAVRGASKVTLRRVLDVPVDIRTTVEAGQVEQRALVQKSAIGHAHTCSFPCSCRPAGGDWQRGGGSRQRGSSGAKRTGSRCRNAHRTHRSLLSVAIGLTRARGSGDPAFSCAHLAGSVGRLHDTVASETTGSADGGGRTLMAEPPVSETRAYPVPPHPIAGAEPQAWSLRAARLPLAHAAGRGRDRSSRSCSRRALRRVSSWITLAGRGDSRFGAEPERCAGGSVSPLLC